MSQQDSRSAGQRAGALYKVDTSFISLSLTIVSILPSYRKLLNSGVGDDAPASRLPGCTSALPKKIVLPALANLGCFTAQPSAPPPAVVSQQLSQVL